MSLLGKIFVFGILLKVLEQISFWLESVKLKPYFA
jgi:hypothetical protein